MPDLTGRAKVWGYVLIVIICLIVLGPFLWILMTSLKTQLQIFMGSWQFEPTWSNYQRVFFSRQSDFLLNTRNSLLVASISTLAVLAVGTFAAYALSWHRWARWFSAAFLSWTLLFHMIPPITLVGPWYLTFRELGILNTLFGLILTHMTLNLPMTIWLMMSFFRDLPRELEEAALIDGCRRYQVLFRILLPLVVPGLMAAGVLAFIFSWNEFTVALNLSGGDSATVPVAIARFAQQYEVRHGEMAAASILSTIPAVVLMFFGQKFIVKGLTLGAIK
jgi:multiple sugar transport system permease protein